MKISHELIINRKRDEVWRIFDNPANMKIWQPTLKKFEHQSGRQGYVGAVSRLVYEENGREIIMTETITYRSEPDGFSGEYATKQATNKVSNQFIKLEGNKTRWVMACEFIFNGVLFKLISPFIKGTIRKRIVNDMNRFKQLAESQ